MSEDKQQQFRQAWVRCLMENLKASVPEPALGGVMAACGRGCAQRHGAAMISKAHGDVEALFQNFAAQIGTQNASREGDEYHLRYPQCYCPMAAGSPERLPDVYCECGRAFVAEVFNAVAGKPVSVELTESIQRGAKQCHFVVRV